MGRVHMQRPHVGTLRTAVAYVPEGEQERGRFRQVLTVQRWYNSRRWRRLRASVLLRDLYTCRRCGRIEPRTSKLVADHRVPHRGDPILFWDERNLQTLCKPCHDSAKQREDKRLP